MKCKVRVLCLRTAEKTELAVLGENFTFGPALSEITSFHENNTLKLIKSYFKEFQNFGKIGKGNQRKDRNFR